MPSPIFKRIVCLANSRKHSGRCIAGKEILRDGSIGGWIRPVSARASEEVSEYEREYDDGSDPRVLDVIRVPLKNALPKGFQRENWLLDPDYYWEKIRRVGMNELTRLTDSVPALWMNGYSSGNGVNDRIPITGTSGIESSLRLIRVSNIELFVFAHDTASGKPRRRVQGHFRYNGADYGLWVTDPQYERAYLQKPDGNYRIGECFLTVSLGDEYLGYAYKLIAAIIETG